MNSATQEELKLLINDLAGSCITRSEANARLLEIIEGDESSSPGIPEGWAPDAYAVIDHKGQINYTVTASEAALEGANWARGMCHDHINDAVADGTEGAGRWVVRALTIGDARQETEWLPIESAPRDGTYINGAPCPGVRSGDPVAWFTEDHLTDKSATTYDSEVAERWRKKGWPVTPLYASAPKPGDSK